MSSDIFALLFYGSAVESIFSSESQLRKMVLFEHALAGAVEDAGLAPAGTTRDMEQASTNFPSSDHVARISKAAVASGNIAIPFVKELTSAVREHAAGAAEFVHFGATSQDVLDTALVLQLREFFLLLQTTLDDTCRELVTLTQTHKDAILPGRTWMQQGPPILFAQKTAAWLSALLRHRQRLVTARNDALSLQFGGAVGNLASLGTQGKIVAERLAARLQLSLPEIPWHTQRDNLAQVATTCGLLVGTLGKIAKDLSLLMQSEVAEVHERLAEGEGGSSTMPHKRNPVNPALILSAATSVPGLVATMLSAMPQEHERGLGGWHAEWTTLPEICKLTVGALDHTRTMLSRLEIDRKKMNSDLALLQGAAMAEAVTMLLATKLGRPEAHRLMERVSRKALTEHSPLEQSLNADPIISSHISADEISKILDPAGYLGQSNSFIAQVLARAAQELPAEAPDAHR